MPIYGRPNPAWLERERSIQAETRKEALLLKQR
ncbi:MAG: hypothetical protein K0R62_5442 [Nonomuraea muscovyensis]|nr:hypothetical protein [Nonomuraea muscovyensis]